MAGGYFEQQHIYWVQEQKTTRLLFAAAQSLAKVQIGLPRMMKGKSYRS